MKSENDVISDDELIELTGYKYPSKQCEALTRAGISFITRKDGRPSVTWSALNATLSGFSVKTVPDNTPEQPNFDAM